MTRLTEISISGLRGIRQAEIKGLADINVLVGRNNCGKSTVLEAIYLAAALPQDPLGRHRWEMLLREHNEEHGGPLPEDLWYRPGGDVLQLSAKFGQGTVVEWLLNRQGSGTPKVPNSPDLQEFMRGVTHFFPRDAWDPSIEVALWDRLLRSRADKVLTQALRDVFSFNIEGIAQAPSSRVMLLFPEAGIPLDSQGGGVRTGLRHLMVLSLLRKTLFMTEEPESHQHPQSLRGFGRIICDLAKKNEVQVVLTTHSVECVRAFLDGAEAAKLEFALHHLTRSADGEVKSRRLASENVRALQGMDTDIRFLDLYD